MKVIEKYHISSCMWKFEVFFPKNVSEVENKYSVLVIAVFTQIFFFTQTFQTNMKLASRAPFYV